MRPLILAAAAAALPALPGNAAQTRIWNSVADFQGGSSYSITVSPTGSAGRAFLTLERQSYYACDPTSACTPTVSWWSNDPQQGRDWRLTQYDPDGLQLWTESYNSISSDNDTCYGIGLDSAGNLVVVGDETRGDTGEGINLRIRRYTASGGFVSAAEYNSVANSTDQAIAVTVSASGAAVVVGNEHRADVSQGMNWVMRKYDAAGGLLWTKTYNDAGNYDDYANGVAFDATGGFVVAGTDYSLATGIDWRVTRFDPNGNQTWTQAFNSPGNGNDEAIGVAVSGAGTVAVVGYEDRTYLGQGRAWLVEKFSAGGGLLSAIPCASVATPPSGVATGVGTDILGNYVMVGWEDRSDISEGENWVVRKYDLGGTQTWLRAYDGPAHGNDRAAAVAVDAGGSSVVAGWVDRSDAGQGDDWLVRRYDPDGVLVWSRTYNGPANGADHATAVGLSAKGEAVVAGFTWSGTAQGDNWFVRKYDTAGLLMWTRTFNGPANGDDRAMAVAVAKPSGSVYVAGYETVTGQGRNWRVYKYSASGNVLWTFTVNGIDGLDDEATALAIDNSSFSSSVYVAGTVRTAAQGANWMVWKFTQGGTVLYSQAYNSPDNGDDILTGVGTDKWGNFALSGSEVRTGESTNWRVNRYAPGGSLSWSQAYNSPGSLDDAAMAVGVTTSGTVVAVGYENRTDIGLGNIWRAWQMSPDGTTINAGSVISGTCANDSVARAAAFDASENLIVVGFEDRPDLAQGHNWLIRKYDISGALAWSAGYNSAGNAEDEATSVAIDTLGNIIVGGYVLRNDVTQGKNQLVRKYSPSGALLWSKEYSSNSINDDVIRGVAVDAAGNVTTAGDEYRYDQTQVVPLPYAVLGQAVARVGNRVYIIGGCIQESGGCGAPGSPPYSGSAVYFAPIDETGDSMGVGKGRIGPWTRANYLYGDTGPAAAPWGPPKNPTTGIIIMRHKAVGVGNRIYVVGGTTQNCGTGPSLPGAAFTTAQVYSTAVDPVTGQTGPWESEIPLIQNATDHGLVYAAGALYCLGGQLAANTPMQFVQKAEIGPDGHLYSANTQSWDAVLAMPPGNPPDTCNLCSLCTCTQCAPCTSDCCRALNVCLGWNNMSPVSVMRTIGFLGGEYVPGSSGNVCRYSRGSIYGFLDDCNQIRSWYAGPGTDAHPGSGVAAYNGSLLSVGGGNGSAMQNQVLFNSVGLRGFVRTGSADLSELRPGYPDGTELYKGAIMPHSFPVVVPNSPLIAFNGFVYAVGGEIGGSSSPCQRVYRVRLPSTSWWVDSGSWLSPPYDLGSLATMKAVSWSFTKTGLGAADDWAMVRYRVAAEDGRWTCWTPRVPEEGSAPDSPGYYTYSSDVSGRNPFFKMPLAPDPFRYLQFEVSLYNNDGNDAGVAPTIPRFDEFKVSYEPAPVSTALGSCDLEILPAKDGNSITIRYEIVADGGEVTVEFYNVAAELAASEKYAYIAGGVKAEKIDTSRWANGVYIIIVKGIGRNGGYGFYCTLTREKLKKLKGRLVIRRR